jgi:hypothetical protein
MIDQLTQMIQSQGSEISILLILALVLVFVAAFKVMEMVFDTVVVSVLSGAFYVSLRYLQGGPVDLNDLLLFSFLGASLYMLYSFLSTLWSVGATVIPLPFKALEIILKPFRYLWDKYQEHQKRKSYVDRDKKDEEEDEDKSTKEVVLGNRKEDDKEE